MKVRNSIVCLLLATVMALVLTACGSSGGSNAGGLTKTEEKSGDVVSAQVPEGWCFVSGTDMNGADLADFICHADEFELGDPYLQADDASGQTLDEFVAVLESEDPFGEYYGEKQLTNGTWYISKLAAATQLEGSDKVLRVRSYECDLQSSEVQQIMGSLQWAG